MKDKRHSFPPNESNDRINKIRILHCIETIASGGVEQVRLTMIRGLDPEKYEHKIICTWKGGPIAEALEAEGVEVIPIGSFRHPFQWSKHKRVLKVIKGYRPHIIHGAIFEGMTMAAIGGKLGKVPIIILEETSDPQNRSTKASWLLKQLVRLADKIIAISPDVKTYLKEIAKVNPEKISLINNGITLPNYPDPEKTDSLRKKLKIDNDEIVIGFVGRLYNDHKRITDLLTAVSMVKYSNIRLLIVGDGGDRNIIQAKISELNIASKVIMVGYQHETSPYYTLMDIFCVPSAREGFGLVAAEAMLHHLPVIASKVGGLQNIIIDGETGYLIPPLIPEILAEKIQSLINHPEIRKSMGKKGFARAMKNYTAERYGEEVDQLYSDLLQKKGMRV